MQPASPTEDSDAYTEETGSLESALEPLHVMARKLFIDPVALGTLVLAIFTFYLWRVTNKAVRDAGESIDAAKTSAAAAMLQAKVMIASERASLSVLATPNIVNSNELHVLVQNTGRTTAEVFDITHQHFAELPESADWLRPGISYTSIGASIPAGKIGVVGTADLPVWSKHLLGFIEYADVFDGRRRQYFRYDRSQDGSWSANGDGRWGREEEITSSYGATTQNT